jgi:PAS domain S-box-containing protein
MLLYLRRWLAPPVFPDAEVKTQRANVLNAALLTTAALAAMILAGNLLGGTTPLVVNLADVAAIVIFFVLRGWLQRGQLSLAGAALLGMDLAGTTLLVALLGTIRTPTTAFYLLIVVGGGLLFDVRGILVTTAASSLAVFGLIAAENAGLLPQPDYAVTITQWITYSALFGLSGGLTHVALQATRQALAHAEQQLAERRRAEDQREAALAALQQSEGLYHTLVETLPLNIFRKDTAGRLTFANTLYCRTQGWPLAEVLGKTDYDLHPRELADKYKVDDERIIASGEPFGTVEVHQPIDGPQSYVQVIKVPLFAADGRVMGIQGAFWDVTARQQVEEVLRQSRSNLQTILDNFPFMAWLKDTEGRFVAVNEPFAHACGRSSPDDVIGKTGSPALSVNRA